MTASSSFSVPSNPFGYPSAVRGLSAFAAAFFGGLMFALNFICLYVVDRSPVAAIVPNGLFSPQSHAWVPDGSVPYMIISLIVGTVGIFASRRLLAEEEAAAIRERDAQWIIEVWPPIATKTSAPIEKSASSAVVPMSDAKKLAARRALADLLRIRKEAERGGELDGRVSAIMGLWFLSQGSFGRRRAVESHAIRRRAIENLIEKMRRGEIREDSVIQCLNGTVVAIVDVMRREDCMELRRICPRLLALCDAYTGGNNN